jgi:hypothetical protein
MAVDEVEFVLSIEHPEHRVDDVAADVAPEPAGAERSRDRWRQAAGNVRVTGREGRHVVASPDQLGDELVDDAFGAAVALGWDALDRRCHLGDTERLHHGPRFRCSAGTLSRAAAPPSTVPRPLLDER